MANPPPLQHGLTYHIYNRGVNREPIFRSDAHYRYFLDLYAHHVGWLVDTYAYCLLGNHFHFLLRVKDVEALDLTGLASSAATRTDAQDLSGLPPNRDDEDLTGLASSAATRTGTQDLSGLGLPPRRLLPPSRYFSNFFNAYARAFNKATGRTGALFQRLFGRIVVDTDGYFSYLIVYIHQNPQKHGFVDNYRDWRYASYDALAGNQPTRLARAGALDYLGGRSGFEMAHREDMTSREDASGL